MDGLAKSAPQQENTKSDVPSTGQNNIPVLIDGIPIEMIRYFDVDIRKIDSVMNRQLRDIYEATREDNKSMGDVLLKIKEVDRKLGYPAYGERFSKVWNYFKINKNIEELHKQQQALIRN